MRRHAVAKVRLSLKRSLIRQAVGSESHRAMLYAAFQRLEGQVFMGGVAGLIALLKLCSAVVVIGVLVVLSLFLAPGLALLLYGLGSVLVFLIAGRFKKPNLPGVEELKSARQALNEQAKNLMGLTRPDAVESPSPYQSNGWDQLQRRGFEYTHSRAGKISFVSSLASGLGFILLLLLVSVGHVALSNPAIMVAFLVAFRLVIAHARMALIQVALLRNQELPLELLTGLEDGTISFVDAERQIGDLGSAGSVELEDENCMQSPV